MDNLFFDLRTKVALGLSSIDEIPFSRASIFNFQKRLNNHEEDTGINLLESTFNKLTSTQLEKLKIKTDIQRSDSTLISSNIKNYGRIELLIELLLRVSKTIEVTDRDELLKIISDYTKTGSQEYVYKLSSENIPHELNKLGSLYLKVLELLQDKYSDIQEFKNLKRTFNDHFEIEESIVSPKENKDIASGTLQSPDDTDATYRNKRGEKTKGFSLNGTETANPENKLQLPHRCGC